MCKRAGKFNASKGCKLAIVVIVPTSPFSKQKFVVNFSNVICTKTRPCTHLTF